MSRPKFLSFLIASVFCSSSYAASQWIQLAPITPASLNAFVKQTGLFAAAQSPTDKQTVLYSINLPSKLHYSIYTMQPLAFFGKVTQYKTTEQVEDGSRFPGISKWDSVVVHGKGLSLGGIFWPKESMIARAPDGTVVYDNKIDITAIKPISGNLFPMHVGSELQFEFKRTHSRMFGNQTTLTHETGIMTYKVVSQITNFTFSDKPIPGPIYEIEVWETTNLHPKPYLTDIYYYSDGFHWYVADRYFSTSNVPYAWYRVKTWS